MKQPNRDKSILLHIIQHCEKIQKALARFGDDFETFQNDDVLRDAVSMNLEQIGELAKRYSDEFLTATRPEINWRAISGMRNLFAHDYGAMDIERIWETAINDIPELLAYCKSKLESGEFD
jgi:uncharacterized protein with HEPN domain